jgi:capsular polysaccharide export protein
MDPEVASLGALFPELTAVGAPRYCLENSGRSDPARMSRRFGEVRVLSPGLLRTPPFHKRVPWISGTVGTVWRAGVAEPGWVCDALDRPLSDRTIAEGRELADRLVREQTGGTFWAQPPDPDVVRAECVVVQAGRDGDLNARMLGAVLDQGDAARVVLLLPRPDRTMAERARRFGCTVLTRPVDPWPLLAAATVVHTASGDEELAVLARLAGSRVECHGSDPMGDRHAIKLAAAFLLVGTRYADPFDGRTIDCAAALDIVAEWRRVTHANRAIGACSGMSFWKRRRMATFFHTGERAPPHRRTAAAALRAAKGRAVAVWSSRIPPGLQGPAVLRVEDGFVRSFGLGSGFLPPCSVIADASGIYYDPSGPSDLETLLRETQFEPTLLARTRRLMDRLVREGVTKYGAGGSAVDLPPADGRRRLLVPGQVADDLSVRLGGAGCVAGNEDLLARVRAAHPDALVIYKPHPDVDAGHRAGAMADAVMYRYADLVVRGVPMGALIAAVDEVHTMTSLAGYEALLRGRRVVVYARPFYAGWGLTEDLVSLPRRGRRLSLEELSAGVLLLYPRYIDPVTELPCPPEVLLDRFASEAVWRETGLMRLRRLQGRLRVRLAR